VKVRTPEMNPTMSLAQRDLKNEPCPQSWKMMKTRTSSAPARIATGIVSHREVCSNTYMAYQSRP
jgi:hypothetical protein